jgi:hypothetical protein
MSDERPCWLVQSLCPFRPDALTSRRLAFGRARFEERGENMAAQKPPVKRKYFTVAEANARLPLVRAIVRDIAALAQDLRERHERLSRVQPPARGALGDAYQEELRHAQAEFDREQERIQEYERELRDLGIELKDPYIGLVDFPARMDGREVYLCWRLGEPEVAYWHDLEAGFAGRQKLRPQTLNA